MKNIAISLALGDIYADGGRGSIKTPIDGAVVRFQTLTASHISGVYPSNSLIVCSAGYSKQRPLDPEPDRVISLAGQLRRYVCRNESDWKKCLIARPLCWSTRNEIRLGIKLALRRGFAEKNEEAAVVIASNFTHLFRIRLYALLYTPKKWHVRLIRARHHFSFRSHILEVSKIARDVFYLIEVWERLRRLKRA